MNNNNQDSKLGSARIFIFALLVILSRLLIGWLHPQAKDLDIHLDNFILHNLSRYGITITMVVMDFLAVFLLSKKFSYKKNSTVRPLLEYLCAICISFITTICLRSFPTFGVENTTKIFDKLFLFTLISYTIINAIIVFIIDIVLYYKSSNKLALQQQVKSDYQYQLLKSQLNPHFLFNSLNVLDYLIQTEPSKASNYVKRLASVYRYLLKIESQPVVYLEEEAAFVKQYINLLQERFGAAIRIDFDIPRDYSRKRIVSCGIQMHIENAVKHNTAHKEKVLNIDINIEDNYIVVKNNIQRKRSLNKSSGIGLNNLKKQYQLLYAREIIIIEDTDFFTVKVPLID